MWVRILKTWSAGRAPGEVSKFGTIWETTPSWIWLATGGTWQEIQKARPWGSHCLLKSQRSCKEHGFTQETLREGSDSWIRSPASSWQDFKPPNAIMAPINIMNQSTINKHRRIVEKDWLTHNQPYNFGSETPVNSQVAKELLFLCISGNCVKCLTNWTVALLGSSTQLPKYSAQRLTSNRHLGGANWITKQLFKLALNIWKKTWQWCHCGWHWQCTRTIWIGSNIGDNSRLVHGNTAQQNLEPERIESKCKKPCAKKTKFRRWRAIGASGQHASRPQRHGGCLHWWCCGFDSRWGCQWRENRWIHSFAIDSVACTKQQSEPLPWEEMEAWNKLEAKATAEETNMILGWLWDFRQLLVSLPTNKFIAWSKDIMEMIKRGKTQANGAVMLFIHHFLSYLQDLHKQELNCRSIKINPNSNST